MLGHPVIKAAVTATILAVLLGLQAIAGGVLEIMSATKERKEIEGQAASS